MTHNIRFKPFWVALAAALTITAAAARAQAPAQDIVDTAVAAGSFKTLATALQAAGLVETLKGKGPFTVFAPTDEAFAKVPKAALDDLLKPENRDKLRRVLTYHVVAGNVPSSKVVTMRSATAVSGDEIRIAAKGNTVMVDEARVVTADVTASNGVIHVIDTVMMPGDGE